LVDLAPEQIGAREVKTVFDAFTVSAGMTAAVNVSPPRIASPPSVCGWCLAAARTRARQEIDYCQIEGVQRWGLNDQPIHGHVRNQRVKSGAAEGNRNKGINRKFQKVTVRGFGEIPRTPKRSWRTATRLK